MKLLVATSLTQGQRGNDFNWCIDGELVRVGLVCVTDEDDPDGGCGCGRAFGGLNSHRATTTAVVREIDGFSRADYVEAVRSSLEQQGWDPGSAVVEVDVLQDMADRWPEGTVVERRLWDLTVRRTAGQRR